MGLIKTLVIIVGVYYIVKFLMRLFAPFLMKYAANKMEKKMKEQFGQKQSNTKNDFSNSSNRKMKTTKKVGEYIDFEEID